MPTTGHPKLTLIRRSGPARSGPNPRRHAWLGTAGPADRHPQQHCSPRAGPPGTQQGGEPGPGGDQTGWAGSRALRSHTRTVPWAWRGDSTASSGVWRVPSLQMLGAGFQMWPCLHSVTSVSCGALDPSAVTLGNNSSSLEGS